MQQLREIPAFFGSGIEVYFLVLLIAVPLFFLYSWLFKKIIRKDSFRKVITWTATLTTTILVYFGLITLLLYWITYTPTKKFTRQEWSSNKNERFQMADDLIKRKLLINKDSNAVKQLLGSSHHGNHNWRSDSANTWLYDMGMGGGGLGFRFHYLLVRFEDGNVATVEHQKIDD